MADLAGLPIPCMELSSLDAPQALRKFKHLCLLYFSGPLKEKREEEQIPKLPKDWRQKKRENIHAIDTADQSLRMTLKPYYSYPYYPKIDTGAEGNVVPVELYKRLCPQSSYSPEGAPLGRTNAFKYNDYCLQGSHHSVIWHL